MQPNSSFVAAVAMSLYIYNVSPSHRAESLYMSFKKRGLPCAEQDDFLRWVNNKNWATEMPFPTAVLYLTQALERYGGEAEERVGLEMDFTDSSMWDE